MRTAVAAVAALALLGAAGGSVAACGGDDATTTAPTAGPETGATGPTDEQGPTAESEEGSGDSTEFDPEKDTEQNDLAPPPGSPEERFERHCEQNPQACD